MTSSSKKNKPLKWTTQRVSTYKSTHDRVHKRTKTTATHNTRVHSVLTDDLTNNIHKEIESLENEISFTYDAVATIMVHYQSLNLTYTSSKPELDKFKNATRLGAMEKELLTAYDDLELQINHLGRKMSKLEKRLNDLKQYHKKQKEVEQQYGIKQEEIKQQQQQQQQQQQCPIKQDEVEQLQHQHQQQQQQQQESNIIVMSSPCSSIDSSISEPSSLFSDQISSLDFPFYNTLLFEPTHTNSECYQQQETVFDYHHYNTISSDLDYYYPSSFIM